MVAHTLDSPLTALAPVAITPVSTIARVTNAASQGQRARCRLCTAKPPLPSIDFAPQLGVPQVSTTLVGCFQRARAKKSRRLRLLPDLLSVRREGASFRRR